MLSCSCWRVRSRTKNSNHTSSLLVSIPLFAFSTASAGWRFRNSRLVERLLVVAECPARNMLGCDRHDCLNWKGFSASAEHFQGPWLSRNLRRLAEMPQLPALLKRPSGCVKGNLFNL